MMNFLKDWIIQYRNKFSVGGVETTIERVTGTVSQEGDTIMASYLNEIQKNCIYQVNATRVIEGVLEIYDISIDGSEEFTPFNQTFLIDFNATNTQVDSLLRFNGITYSLRFSGSIANGDKAPVIGTIPKIAVVKLDVSNSKAIIIDDRTIIQSLLDLKPNLASPAFTGTPTAPTAAVGTDTTQIATTAFVNAMLGGNTIPAKSLAADGYVKLANGLILQWGATSGTSDTFPIAFTTWRNIFLGNTYPNTDNATNIKTYSLTGLTFSKTSGTTFWLAIGQ